MERIKRTKKTIHALMAVFLVFLVILLAWFGIYMKQVNDYNALERTIDGQSMETSVLVDLHPRGQATDSWEKNDAFPDVILKAKIYEATITNSSGSTLKNWSLRINIMNDCYINNAWNGTVEIHQNVDGSEKVQTLSLQDYKESDLTLSYYVCGQDLLIPLSKGDYIIYYPSEDMSFGEWEVESTGTMSGETNIGIIFYSLTGSEDLTDYELTYYLEKGYFDDGTGVAFIVLFATWIAAMLVFSAVSFLMIRYERTLGMQTEATRDFLLIFSNFVDAKDPSMNGHSERVAYYTRLIAQKLGMNKNDCENAYYIGLVHDIGKCQIPDYILKKQGVYSEDERELMKTHTTKGAKMLEPCKSIPHITEGALYHHEWYDGSGYPVGCAGEDIPLIARIICVADSYEAMISGNEYNGRLTPEGAKAELIAGKGKQFDPFLVDVFLDVLQELEKETWEY